MSGITYAQAFTADEFHVAHAGLPCTVWRRCGQTYAMHPGGQVPDWLTGDTGGFFIPVERGSDDGAGKDWHQITGVNAGDFHTPEECPRAHSGRSDNPPVAYPVLDNGYRDETGRDALGFDAEGYATTGYDADGFNREGYDADGYNRDGNDEDGYGRPEISTAGLDLDEQWSGFPYERRRQARRRSDRGRWPGGYTVAFAAHLRKLVTDPAGIDNLGFCGNCGKPKWDADLNSVRGGDMSICDTCWNSWTSCDSCDDRYPAVDLTGTLSGSSVCGDCRDESWLYCDDCNGWYHDEDSDDHDHDYGRGDCCESPQPEFAIRNDGCEPLKNDTRVTVGLPAGIISAEGLTAIKYYLQGQELYALSYNLGKIGDAWQARDGNFAKRLSRLAYKNHQVKLTPEVMSQVGVIAREHSTAVSVDIKVTRDLNQSAEYFYHDGSCWWNSYSESRCALKTNGGFGLLSFDSYDTSGRAWVLPLRQDENGRMTPTFETMTPDAFVVFNGYGEMAGYTAPRILAHMAGWTYRKIEFCCSPMFVNASSYLVAPEAIAEKYTDGSLSLDVSQHSHLYEREQAAQAERDLVTC